MPRWLACALPLLLAGPAVAAPRRVDAGSFSVLMPDGYEDVTEEMRKAGFANRQVSFATPNSVLPSMVFQLAPVYGGNLADLGFCRKSARAVAGPKGTVRSAAIVAGPTGPTCQIRALLPEAAAIVTEINGARETWLMTCNHVDGDAAAEAVCLATLASFAPSADFGRPDPWFVRSQAFLLRLFFPDNRPTW